jgi:hypothetical protein
MVVESILYYPPLTRELRETISWERLDVNGAALENPNCYRKQKYFTSRTGVRTIQVLLKA